METKERTLEQFFKVKRGRKVVNVVISNAFKDENGNPIPWKLRALDIDQIQRVAKDSMVNGELDGQKNQAGLMVASVVSPNLNNADLQDYYGVKTPGALLKAMLLPVEYAKLFDEITKINEFKTDAELVTEVKNG